jgi:multisubunit Na+/H+ antiporter MnhF subunit
MTALARRCRLLLRAYPAAYRQERGEEIIGTLLEATPQGRSWPLARDVRGLAVGGLRARAALNRRLTTAANFRIAALVGVACYLAFSAVAYLRVVVRILTGPNVAHQAAGWPALAVAILVGLAVALAWLSSRRAGAGIAAGVPLLALISAVTAVAVWRLHRQSARQTAGNGS